MNWRYVTVYHINYQNYSVFLVLVSMPCSLKIQHANCSSLVHIWGVLDCLSSLQRSLSKEDDIKNKYEKELQRCHQEKLVLTHQVERALQERESAVKDRNLFIRERNALALQAQQEYERAERYNACTYSVQLACAHNYYNSMQVSEVSPGAEAEGCNLQCRQHQITGSSYIWSVIHLCPSTTIIILYII